MFPHANTTAAPRDAASDAHGHAEPQRRGRLLAVGALPPPITGLSTAFQSFCEGMPSRGWEVSPLDISDRSGERRNASFTFRRAFVVLRLIALTWLRVRRADVLYVTITHSTVGFLRDALLIFGARLFGVPVVLHHHGGAFHQFYSRAPQYLRLIIRSALNQARFIIALDESLRHEFSMVRDAQDRVRIVANACTTPPCPPRAAPSGTLRVLYLSNLMVEKGYLDVLHAASLMGDRLPKWNVEFHFAGKFHLGGKEFRTTEQMEADFRDRALRIAPNTKVLFHGVVRSEAKMTLLRSSDVFVLPTYYRDEGQPISVIEALTSALPVVATAHRGIPGLLPSEMEALLVPPRNGAAIADKLARLACSPAAYDRLAQAAARRAQDFSIDSHLGALDRLLADAASR